MDIQSNISDFSERALISNANYGFRLRHARVAARTEQNEGKFNLIAGKAPTGAAPIGAHLLCTADMLSS
jgi:hypothetical protein